jgi:hypothetical protein
MIKIELTEEEALLTRQVLDIEAYNWDRRIGMSADNQTREKRMHTHTTVTNAQKKVEKALGLIPIKENR